ncbi:MAG: peptidase M14 [Gemmatimonadota bacterium]|nr:MAG: peptidase M14 [Gemmatimonadota bacterium]
MRSVRIAAAAVLACLWVQVPVPLSAQVPTPASVIGWEPGEDYRLADYEQIRGYFEALDAASDRIRVEEIGVSAEGRPLLLATISSEANMRSLERFEGIARQLADGSLEDSEARELAGEGRVVVWIDAGIHATEVAGAQFSPAFAYRMVTGEDPELRRIREEVILLLMPVMNPDGLDLVAEWYRRNLGTPFETAELPVLYQKYSGHDNNRDWFMMQQPETRAVARQLWERWIPQIVVNHHQTGPFPARIFVPPFADPVNPRIPPLVIAGVNLVGTAMQQRFAQEGKPGAVSRLRYTQWWNGGVRTTPYFHNQIGILTEVALHRYATPKYYEPDSIPRTFRGGMSADRPSVWYPHPWRGGWWRIRDAVEYFETASLGVLQVAASMRESWLYDMHRMGRDARAKGARGPFAYLIVPERQRDPGEALELIRILKLGGLRVHRATRPFSAGGEDYPRGTYVLLAAQPFRAHLVDLLEPQEYPAEERYPGGPPDTPYDLAGWTLPLQMGVGVDRVEGPVEIALEEVEEPALPPGRVGGTGARYALSPQQNQAYAAVNRLLEAGRRIWRLRSARRVGDRELLPGTFIVEASPEELRPLAAASGLDFSAIGAGLGEGELVELAAPRIGVYRSWVPSMDEGWARWVLERYGYAYERLSDADIREADLSRFDAILLPHQAADDALHGHLAGTMPDEYTGGLGLEGALQLKRWVEGGGTLIAVDGAADFAIEQFGLPVRNALREVPAETLSVPGSLLRLAVDPADAGGFGMAEETAASFVRSRAFEVVPLAGAEDRGQRPEVTVTARYAATDLLLSGWERGAEQHLAGRPAMLSTSVGRGRVILIGFRPYFRGQPRGTFKLLFNALLSAGTSSAGRDGSSGGVP